MCFLLIARWGHLRTLQLFANSIRDYSNLMKQIYREEKLSLFVAKCYSKCKEGDG